MPKTDNNNTDSDWAWLRAARQPSLPDDAPVLRVVDLFCGCGGMTLGVTAAAARLGFRVEVVLAVDLDSTAVEVFNANFGGATVGDVAKLFPGKRNALTAQETALRDRLGKIDLLVGGPPCQGHSDLNNHTRRDDPRNGLYAVMARAAKVLDPQAVVIENVVAVAHDRADVVGTTSKMLEALSYTAASRAFSLLDFGLAQRRKRHILVATKSGAISAKSVLDALASDQPNAIRTVRWAIGDLEDIDPVKEYDKPSLMNATNKARAQYLHRYKKYNLPNDRRPECHQDGEHTYNSVYGRLWWHKPAQTITTGFTSMGQGRYVHPSKVRTITPHEAARLQSFPDYFDFVKAKKRTDLARLIGNAVPPLAMRRVALALLSDLPLVLAGSVVEPPMQSAHA